MVPKYTSGTKVRIKVHDFMGMLLDSRFNNMITWQVKSLIQSTSWLFISDPWAKIGATDKRISIYHYTIRIDDRIILHDVSEDCLEIVK